MDSFKVDRRMWRCATQQNLLDAVVICNEAPSLGTSNGDFAPRLADSEIKFLSLTSLLLGQYASGPRRLIMHYRFNIIRRVKSHGKRYEMHIPPSATYAINAKARPWEA